MASSVLRALPPTSQPPAVPAARLPSSLPASSSGSSPSPTRSLNRAERSGLTASLLAAAAEEEDESRRQSLLEEVVLINIRVAHAVAQRFAGRGVDREDLEQVASEALVKAVQRFDPSHSSDFLSFAVPTIRGELQRYFRDVGWTVRPTRRVQEAQWLVRQTEDDLTQVLGRTPTPNEVIDEIGLTLQDYAEANAAMGCFRPASLDQSVLGDEGEAGLGDLLSAEDRDLAACEARLTLGPLLESLSPRDRRVLYLRFFEDRTQREIGSCVGVTQTQVSRILDRVLDRMRDSLVPDPVQSGGGPPPAA